jgi:fibronectin-binding autotransporter adhesin
MRHTVKSAISGDKIMNKSALYLIKGIFVWVLFGVNLSYSQQDVYWRGDTSVSNWWDGANPWYYQSWVNTQNRPDNNSSTRNFVFFDNNNQTTTTVNGAFFALNTMTVQSSANLARIYNGSSGGGISLTGGIYINSSANQNFNVDIGVDGSNVSFMGHSGSSIITFANNFYLNGNTATFGGNSASTEIVVSGIAQGTGGKMVKNDSNTLTLSGANTFTGGLTINAGTVRLNHASAPGTGTLTIAGGAIDNTTAATITLANNNAQNWNGNFTFTGTRSLNLGTGAVTMNASREVTVNANTLTVGGVISGNTFGLTKLGSGNLVLTGANTYTGTTVVNAGGALFASNANALGSTDAGTTVNSGGQLRLNSGAGGSITFAAEALTINGPGAGATGATRGALSNDAGNNTYTGQITLGSDSAINFRGANTLTLDVASGDAIRLGAYTLSLNNDNVAAVLNVNDSINGSGGVTVDGAGGGTAKLNAANTYTGTTTLKTSTLALGNVNALQSSTLETSPSGSGGRGLTFTVGGNNTYNLGGLSGDLAINIGGNTLSVGANNANTTTTGVLSGAGGLIKVGNGTLNLGNTQLYTGTTTVNAGLLKVISGGNISSSSTTVNNGGALDVGGTAGSVQVNSGGLLKGSGSAGAVTFQSGSLLNPGNSPGTLTAASATVLGGSTYNWEISALTGTAGTNWDLFSVGGLLNMDGVTSANKWNLVVTGDSGFAGWTDTNSYSYVFAQAASVSGFSSTVGTDVTSLFNITTSGISSKPNASFNVNGDFKVVVGSANGFTTLNLMAVPEPSSGSLLLAGIGSLLVLRRFRKKA